MSEANSRAYCVGCKVVEGDFHLVIQVLDWSTGIDDAGCNHKGVEGPSRLAVLKTVA